jgi:hypothetical protein
MNRYRVCPDKKKVELWYTDAARSRDGTIRYHNKLNMYVVTASDELQAWMRVQKYLKEQEG